MSNVPIHFSMARPVLTTLALAVLTAGSAGAVPPRWHLTLTSFHFAWDTDGVHGHQQDCQSSLCDDEDFRAGNLDNAQGARLGLDRSIGLADWLNGSYGLELGVLRTEYNRSQHDLLLAEGFVAVGLTTTGQAVTFMVRGGFGAALTDDGRGGPAAFGEAGIELALSEAAALRVTARRALHARPISREIALSVVTVPGAPLGSGAWELEWSGGVSVAGSVVGNDLSLGTAPLWQLIAHHRLGGGQNRIGVGLGAVDHESKVRATMGGDDGNQRGKSIFELALQLDREVLRSDRLTLRLGGGARLAGFNDDREGLLHNDEGPIEGGTEAAVFTGVVTEVGGVEAVRLVLAVDQLYWPRLRLGELRVRVGATVRP